MPIELYHDIQSTIQDAFYAAHIFNRVDSTANLYLYQLGTDQLEELFGVIRTLTHARNCDFLELLQRLVIAYQIETVFNKHLDWKRKTRLCTAKNRRIESRCKHRVQIG
jgi:hypothetical protein